MTHRDIPGKSGFLWLYDKFVAEAQDGARVVEIGLGIGHSISYLLHKVIESGKDIEVWGVDPFNGQGRNGEQQAAGVGDFGLFTRYMLDNAAAEFERLNFLRLPSTSAAHLFPCGHFDLVLIDGNHDYPYVMEDIAAWKDTVKPGGTLAGDDHIFPFEVERACLAWFGRDYKVTHDPELGNPTWWKVMP